MMTVKSTALCAAIALSVLGTAGSAQASLTLGPPTALAEAAKTAKLVKGARFTSAPATPRRARAFTPRFRGYGDRC